MKLSLVIRIYFALLCMAMFKNSIPDGTKSCCQSGTDDMLESLYKMRIRGSDQLKTVQALYE